MQWRLTNLFVGVTAAAFFSIHAVWALMWWFGSVLSIAPSEMLDAAQDDGRIFPVQQWISGRDLTEQAILFDPANASLYLYLGRLSQRAAESPDRNPADTYAYRNYAEEAFHAAIERRPTWGVAWSDYALARLMMGFGLPGVFTDMQNALVMAPYDPLVQARAMFVFSRGWPALPSDIKASFKANIAATLRYQFSAELLRLIANVHLEAEFRDYLTSEGQRQVLENSVRERTKQ